MAEFLPGYEASGWYGISAPKDTPPEIVEQAQQGDQRQHGRSQDQGSALPSSDAWCRRARPPTIAKFVAGDTEKWGKVVRTAGIKAQ